MSRNDHEPNQEVHLTADSEVDEGGDVAGATGMSRRSLLAAGVGLAAAACARTPEPSGKPEVEPELHPVVQAIRNQRRVVGRVSEEPSSAALAARASTVAPPYFPQPGEITLDEVEGEKQLTLTVEYLDYEFVKLDGTIVRGKVRAYNRHVPGPTIRCNAGDKLNILLKNQLPPGETFVYDYQGCKTASGLGPAEAGLPHAFNTTNLHTHGLHVSPKSLCGTTECGTPPYSERPTLASDDVFIEVAPGEEQKYCIVLPDFHAPGTHWYHAHKHGATSIQVDNGLVGALIVREQGDDRILGDQQHEDQIFLIQEIMESDSGNDQLVYASVRGDTSKFFVNGVYKPRLRMHTGEIQRWRFINGTSRPRGLAKLRLVKQGVEPLRDTSDIELTPVHGRNLEDSAGALMAASVTNPELAERVSTFQRIARENAQPMFLIAVDGISFYGNPPRKVLGWDIAPGNRADFLVKIDEPGTYEVVKDLHDYAAPGNPPEVQTLAIIEVTAGTTDMTMPEVIPGTPPCYLKPIESTSVAKTVDFQAVGSGQWGTVCPDDPVPWTCAGEDVVCDGTTRPCNTPDMPPLLPRIFAIDCARFDGKHVEAKYTMQLNTAEEWTLRNLGGGAHPFHIHVNPFQVVEIFNPATGETTTFDPEVAPWQDVVALPLASGGTPGHVKIRQRFLTFPGDFVIHCHFLNHEDLGMMKRVRIVAADGQGHGPCQPVRDCSLT